MTTGSPSEVDTLRRMNGEPSPAGASVFATAVQWVGQIFLGTLAQAIAVIAVASVGFLLLSGRIDVRRGVQAILGCFILFGATSIAAGIMSFATGSPDIPAAEPAQPRMPSASPATVISQPYDPYAGAVMPTPQ